MFPWVFVGCLCLVKLTSALPFLNLHTFSPSPTLEQLWFLPSFTWSTNQPVDLYTSLQAASLFSQPFSSPIFLHLPKPSLIDRLSTLFSPSLVSVVSYPPSNQRFFFFDSTVISASPPPTPQRCARQKDVDFTGFENTSSGPLRRSCCSTRSPSPVRTRGSFPSFSRPTFGGSWQGREPEICGQPQMDSSGQKTKGHTTGRRYIVLWKGWLRLGLPGTLDMLSRPRR